MTKVYTAEERLKVIRSLHKYDDASELSEYEQSVLDASFSPDWRETVFFDPKKRPIKRVKVMITRDYE